MFQAVRTLNRKEDNTILIHNSKGEIIHNEEEELKEITKYFENIFKKDQIHPIPEIPPQKLQEEITSREVKEAVDKLKNNKSPGCDEINAELLKNSPIIIFEHIAAILNQIAETGEKPKELSLGLLIPLPKPNKPKGPVKNLRPIILLSILRKILAIITINRTFDIIRKEIKNSQAAYSPGRSTTELVFTFKTLIEQAVCSEDLTIHLILLDMSRAFDTIERGVLLEDLKEILEPDILHLVNLLLTDVQIQVKYKNKLGETFKPDIGSPQGDCASPIWFIFYLHKALEYIKPPPVRDTNKDTNHDHTYSKNNKNQKINKTQKEYIIDQQYADDISWITTNINAKEYIKNTVPETLTNKNLLVNQEKTEEYTINRKSNQDWKTCKYLGSLLGNDEDIKRRKILACEAFRKNKKCLTSNKIHLKIRLRIFEALITPIFLYNSELWTLKYNQKSKIDTFQRNFLRQILRTKRIRNIDLYRRCNSVPWTITIQQRRLKWFGHLQRLPENTPARIAYKEVTEKPTKKIKGGQKLTWHHTIERDFKKIDHTVEQAIQISKNREKYKEVVDRIMAEAVAKIFPEDGDQPGFLPGQN